MSKPKIENTKKPCEINGRRGPNLTDSGFAGGNAGGWRKPSRNIPEVPAGARRLSGSANRSSGEFRQRAIGYRQPCAGGGPHPGCRDLAGVAHFLRMYGGDDGDGLRQESDGIGWEVTAEGDKRGHGLFVMGPALIRLPGTCSKMIAFTPILGHQENVGQGVLVVMHRPVYRFAVAPVIAALLMLAAPAAFAHGAPDSFADMAEKLLPAVVNIATTQKVSDASRSDPNLEELFKKFFDRQNRGNNGGSGNGDNGGNSDNGGSGGGDSTPHEVTSLGSGFIIDPAGYIVTNNHVIEGAEEITVRLQNNTEYKAKLVGHDPKTDLALLKVDAPAPLPAVEWGDSDKARIGDWVLAIGNPFGLGGTVTAGIVSARQRDINAGPYDDFIQTDAPINRGNSGGPMFDMDGKVIGINTAIFSPSGGSIGIGFALPSSLAKGVIAQLRQFGHPRRGWLGVRIQSVTPELAQGLKMPKPMGALIAAVTDGGPADKAGIKRGDVVIRFNNQDIGEMRHLPVIVAETPFDTLVPVTVLRQGKEMKFQVKLGELNETAEAKQAGTAEKSAGRTQAGGQGKCRARPIAGGDEQAIASKVQHSRRGLGRRRARCRCKEQCLEQRIETWRRDRRGRSILRGHPGRRG